MVVGKNTVAPPLVFLGDNPGPGDITVKGEIGKAPILVISSIKLAPLLNGELTRVAEVGSP